MDPLESFFQTNFKPRLVKRTFHRPQNGGFESWDLILNENINYHFLGDIRYLENIKEKAFFISIYKKIKINEKIDNYTSVWDIEDSYNYDSLLHFITKFLPYIQNLREYRYIVFVEDPGWEQLHTLIKKELNVIELPNIKEEIFMLFNEAAQIEIDSGITNFYICDFLKKLKPVLAPAL